jgi:putative nucleotidyltransferase with HDIG domain
MRESFFKRILPAKRNIRITFLLITISFIIANVIIIFATKSGNLFLRYNIADFKIYEPAPAKFILDRDILWIDDKATEEKREAVAAREPLVFRISDQASSESLNRIEEIKDLILERSEEEGKKELLLFKRGGSEKLNDHVIGYLKSSPYKALILENAERLLREALQAGIVDFTGIEADWNAITSIRFLKQVDKRQIVELIPMDNVIRLQDLPGWVEQKLRTISYDDQEAKQVITSLVTYSAEVNSFYDKNQTELNRERVRKETEAVVFRLEKDLTLVNEGEIISKEIYSKINAYWQNAIKINVNLIVGTIFFSVIIFAFTVFLLNKSMIKRVLQLQEMFLLVILGIIYLVLSVSLVNLIPTEEFFPLSLILPTAMISILLTLVISREVSVVYSLFLSLMLLLIKSDLATFGFAFFSAVGGVAVATRVMERIQLVKAGIFLSLINSAIIAALGFLDNLTLLKILEQMIWAAGNGFLCGILSVGFLPILEHRLNTPTRFRLMELSDINLPILKRMLVLAPGTYNHSINVANLAESACEEIGANALLARVASYYHDIGKLDQPEYFIENQNSYNIHDELKPSLSVAVIKSHVKVGIEKAKELNLPQAVVDIITQHHGKAIISYFYNRALRDNYDDSKISSSKYSYPGIKPQSKEAAVVMLADAVEAASRTLKKPTVAKIEKLVWGIIVDKFNIGELSECNLTFSDLEIIKKTFVRIVAGYFHQRIEYPKIKEVIK